MKGIIVPLPRLRKCPDCNAAFTLIPRIGYVCPACKKELRRYCIKLYHEKKSLFIYCDKTGLPIDTYDRAKHVLFTVNAEIRAKKFDPSFYLKKKQGEYFTNNLLDEYEEEMMKVIAPSYRSTFKARVRMAKEFFGTELIAEITDARIEEYKDHLTVTRNQGAKTLRNTIEVFQAFMNWCRDGRRLTKDKDGNQRKRALTTVPPFPKIKVTNQREIETIANEDQFRIIEALPEADRPIVAFLMLHGCRPGEARALKCKDANLRDGTIRIHATMSGNEYMPRRKAPRLKPAHAYTVFIHEEMFGYIAERVGNSLPEAYLFTTSRGRPYSEQKFRRMWEKVRAALGLPKEVRMYDCTRHSFATNLIDKGVSREKVSELMGHCSPAMTDKYVNLKPRHLKGEIQKLSVLSVYTRCTEGKGEGKRDGTSRS